MSRGRPKRRPLSLYPPQTPALTQAHFPGRGAVPQQGHLQMPRREGKPRFRQHHFSGLVGPIPLAGCVPWHPHSPPRHRAPAQSATPSPSLRSLPPRQEGGGSLPESWPELHSWCLQTLCLFLFVSCTLTGLTKAQPPLSAPAGSPSFDWLRQNVELLQSGQPGTSSLHQ